MKLAGRWLDHQTSHDRPTLRGEWQAEVLERPFPASACLRTISSTPTLFDPLHSYREAVILRRRSAGLSRSVLTVVLDAIDAANDQATVGGPSV